MSDRELLKLAAKAAGIDYHATREDGTKCIHDGRGYWNPLTNDGDALRLAVTLGEIGFFRLNFGAGAVSAENPAAEPLPLLYACEDMEELGSAAATRRAIVKAAAEIGRSMT